MISRLSADMDWLGDDELQRLARVVTKKAKLYNVVASAEAANKTCAMLQARGYTAFAEKTNDDFYKVMYSGEKRRLRVADASALGLTKCTDGLYRSFEREAGVYDYDFDDGAVWRVESDENGEEYLVKTVDDEGKVVRTASANTEAFVTSENYVDALRLLYGEGLCDAFVNDVEHDSALKAALIASLNTKVEAKVKSAVRMFGKRSEGVPLDNVAQVVRRAHPVTAQQLVEVVGRYMLENKAEA